MTKTTIPWDEQEIQTFMTQINTLSALVEAECPQIADQEMFWDDLDCAMNRLYLNEGQITAEFVNKLLLEFWPFMTHRSEAVRDSLAAVGLS